MTGRRARVLLVNPPLSDPIGPYPAICYLAGFLQTIGRDVDLADASLELLLRLFSARGICEIAQDVRARLNAGEPVADTAVKFLSCVEHYASTVEIAVACLQGRDHGALARASRPRYFPPPLSAETWAIAAVAGIRSYEADLGSLTAPQRHRLAETAYPVRPIVGAPGGLEEIRFRAAGVLDDICRVVRGGVDPDFEIDGYASSLGAGLAHFDPIHRRLHAPPNVIDRFTDELAVELLDRVQPDVVGFSVPFPGVLLGAVRMAAAMKHARPGVVTVLGGGYVNTELRQLSDPGIFDVVDYVTLDDGERPLQCVIEVVEGTRSPDRLLRTFRRAGREVVLVSDPSERDVPFSRTGTPTYRGLPLDRCFGFRPALLPFPRVFGRRWNKLTLAHGCYWKRCTFCDTSLDYIGRYEPVSVDVIVDRIRRLRDETGETGFHFVDEAMPPALMQQLARRLIAERLAIAWWGNVRFDRALAPMAPLLAESGCIGLTGGLEAATDRLLALIDKGVSLEQAARVCGALARADIHTHAYLIFGFPTQTTAETMDALEFVRQMFEAGALRSAFWHRFALTSWSPIARDPARFGIAAEARPPNPFSNYVRDYTEPDAADHDALADGLRRAVEAYMLGTGFDRAVESWFRADVPAPTLPRDFVSRAMAP